MSENGLRVAVVIPTLNRCEDTLDCLASLAKSTYPIMSIIVVDNGSTDDTVAMVKKSFPEVLLLELEDNLGATGASNLGFTKALELSAQYVLRLDSDTIVDPDCLRQLLDFAERHPGAGVFSPKIYFFEPSDQIWYAGAKAHRWHMGAIDTHRFERDTPENSQVAEEDYAWAAAMLIRSDALQKTGGFDTDFLVYHEELDFCRRVKAAGYSIWFFPAATVWHKASNQSGNGWKAYHWNRSKMIFYRKHSRNYWHRLGLILYAFAYLFFRALFPKFGSGNRGPVTEGLRGLVDGLKSDSKIINLIDGANEQ